MDLQCDSSLVVQQQVKHMHSESHSHLGSNCNVHRRQPTGDGCVSVAMLAEFTLISLSHSGEHLWLSLEESGQGWREAGRGWCRQREGGGDWASGTADICILLSCVTGRWKGGESQEHSGGFGRTVAEVQESKMQCNKISPSHRSAWPLRAGKEMLK